MKVAHRQFQTAPDPSCAKEHSSDWHLVNDSISHSGQDKSKLDLPSANSQQGAHSPADLHCILLV